MKIDLEAFRKHEQEKLITCREHESADLLIWNYTPRAQFDRVWNEVTMQARGLITDTEGNVIARPFKKFFNYGEHDTPEVLSLEGATVSEKLDGSLGVMYFDGEDHWIATRGSFHSEQAGVGTLLLEKQIKEHGTDWIRDDVTYLFEIIYPENRIVVDYGSMEALILLAGIVTETGEEVPIDELEVPWNLKAHQWKGYTDIKALYDLERDNSEGLVIRFADGLRLKLKWDEYVRLHRIVTGVSSKTIWEALANGDSLDEILDRVPDEFFQWVIEKKAELEFIHREFRSVGQHLFDVVKHLPTRKEQALALKEKAQSPTPMSVAFALLDGKPEEQIAQRIWKAIKPTHERPYRTDIDS